jgi:hypothetical protein
MIYEAYRNSMEETLAYFLTWTTYGSWLPGDERNWVDKRGELRLPDFKCQNAARERMTEHALTFEIKQRLIVEDTIAEHCRIRHWQLYAVAARNQHIHVVVSAVGRTPDDVMSQFKAWCTRKLKDHERTSGAKIVRKNWWTQRGSKRWLNDTKSIKAAVRYVLEEQGEPTPRSQKGNSQA